MCAMLLIIPNNCDELIDTKRHDMLGSPDPLPPTHVTFSGVTFLIEEKVSPLLTDIIV
jgi:hypothetical protein